MCAGIAVGVGEGARRRLIYDGNFSLFLSWLRASRGLDAIKTRVRISTEYLHNTGILSSHAADGNYISVFTVSNFRLNLKRVWKKHRGSYELSLIFEPPQFLKLPTCLHQAKRQIYFYKNYLR